MARTKGGLFGPVSGKIGRVVCYNLRGQEIARTIGEKPPVTAPATLAQNNRMSVLMEFFNKVKPFIKAGFKNEAEGTIYHYHNFATSYNMVAGIAEINGVATLQYDGILLSRGTALTAQNPQVVQDDTGLSFSWDVDPALHWRINKDQVMMLAWFPDIKEAIIEVAGVIRSAGTDHLLLPPSYRNQRMETYIAFVAEDRESVSNSLYLGRIN